VLESLPPEQRPVAEQVLRGGIPAVRTALHLEREKASAEGRPAPNSEALLSMAEDLLPRLKAAEWRDRAEAAAKVADEIALRDLRSVVAGADVARDEEGRRLAATLREALERRVDAQREEWLTDVRTNLEEGRVVRALRLSGRPPDPGTRFPAELATQLAEAASQALSPDTPADRWAALLEAVTVSPVRRAVKPLGLPAEAPEDLLQAARQSSGRIPALAALLGISMPPPPGPIRPARRSGSAAGRPSSSGRPSTTGRPTPPRRPVPSTDRPRRADDQAPTAKASLTESVAPPAESVAPSTESVAPSTDIAGAEPAPSSAATPPAEASAGPPAEAAVGPPPTEAPSGPGTTPAQETASATESSSPAEPAEESAASPAAVADTRPAPNAAPTGSNGNPPRLEATAGPSDTETVPEASPSAEVGTTEDRTLTESPGPIENAGAAESTSEERVPPEPAAVDPEPDQPAPSQPSRVLDNVRE
jgi:hypothetical protein